MIIDAHVIAVASVTFSSKKRKFGMNQSTLVNHVINLFGYLYMRHTRTLTHSNPNHLLTFTFSHLKSNKLNQFFMCVRVIVSIVSNDGVFNKM